MKVFGIKTTPTNKQIVYWYFKQYSFIIFLTVTIFMLFNFGGNLYLKIIFIFLALFIPFTFTKNIKRIIFKITFDDDSKKLLLDYFILWKKRRVIPYHQLHVESIIKFNRKLNQEELHIYIWRKEFLSGLIAFPSKNGFWDRNQMVTISEKFHSLVSDNQTYKPREDFQQEEIGKNNSSRRVEYFT